MGAKVHIQNFDNWIQDRTDFHNPVDMFGENLDAMVQEEGSIFPIQKDEVIKVEELYRCNDLGDDVLGLNASNQRMHYNFGEFLTLEYHPTKTGSDIPDSNPNLRDDIEIFCDEILGEDEGIFPQEKNIFSDSCKDYLVGDCFNDSNSVDASEAASFQVLDNMTVRNMSGCGTTVTNKQCLKSRRFFSSHDLLPSNDNQSNVTLPTINQCSKVGGSLFSDVFNFKKKPRLKRVERKWQSYQASSKELSLEGDGDLKTKSPEIEEDKIHVAFKRSRKPTQWYAKEFMGKNIWHQKKKRGASTGGSKIQHQSKRYEVKRFICSEKTFNGECIQVPFGEPILSHPTKKKVHQPKGLKKGTGLVTSSIDAKVESFSVESQEDISEDDCNEEKFNKTQRKPNNYWSISEVLDLVEGVSRLGVGKWTEIKKLKFNSSPNRTSVDLKDKWRNLLRASCSKPKKKSEAEKKRHPSQKIPKAILRQVKELAVMHPYPRPTQSPQTSCVVTSSPHPSSEHGICLPLSTAVVV